MSAQATSHDSQYPVPRTPEQVPERVAPEQLWATLSRGRPPTPELITAAGFSCPAGRTGDGDREVVLVHGLGHDVWDWGPIWARCPEGMQLRYFDLPGFGLAEKPPGLRMADLVGAVLDVVRTCERPPLVVGSSLGGHVVMLAALAEPDAMAGLLLVSPGGLERVPVATQSVARGYYSLPALLARPEVEIVSNSRRIFAKPSDAREALAVRKLSLHRSPLRAEFARPFASIVDDVFRHPVAERLLAIKPPVQMLFGAEDVVVDPSSGRRAAEAAGVPIEILDGVGHLPMVEAPDRFALHLNRAASVAFGDRQRG